MKPFKYIPKTQIQVNDSYQAMPIEMELVKVTQEKTPIQSIAPEIFTERKAGVMPEYDIRTDKWDIAHETMAKVAEARVIQMNEQDKKPAVGENNAADNTAPNDAV